METGEDKGTVEVIATRHGNERNASVRFRVFICVLDDGVIGKRPREVRRGGFKTERGGDTVFRKGVGYEEIKQEEHDNGRKANQAKRPLFLANPLNRIGGRRTQKTKDGEVVSTSDIDEWIGDRVNQKGYPQKFFKVLVKRPKQKQKG